ISESAPGSLRFVFDGGGFNWPALPRFFCPLAVPAQNSAHEGNFLQAIPQALSAGDQGLVKEDDSHRVHRVFGLWDGNNQVLEAIDPGYTLASGNLVTSVQPLSDYSQESAQILENKINVPGFNLQSQSPVDYVVTSPSGARLGFDPITNTSYSEIP